MAGGSFDESGRLPNYFITASPCHDERLPSGGINTRILLLVSDRRRRRRGYKEMICWSDYDKFEIPPLRSHAIYGSLLGDGLIESLEIYRKRGVKKKNRTDSSTSSSSSSSRQQPSGSAAVVVCDVRIGGRLTGHEGIVHGGIISLLFDEVMGWAYEFSTHGQLAARLVPAFTANLTLNFRSPVEAGVATRVLAFYEKTEGRKVYISGRMESTDGSVVYADATSVFVVMNSRL